MNAEQITSLEPALKQLTEPFRKCFREPTFKHFLTYMLGLIEDLPRKNVETIALAAGVAVRTLQEFLSQLRWDHDRLHQLYQHLIADRHSGPDAIGVIDSSAHPKQGDKTPGVQRQYCGQTGKLDNCVVGVHLLYTDNHPTNPFSCMLDSGLYLPRGWDNDEARRKEAGIPDDLHHQPDWQIAVDMLLEAQSNGIRFSWMTFDEGFGKVPAFWFGLDTLGLRSVGEVPANFRCWPTEPKYDSVQGPFASKEVQNVVRHSPAFYRQDWQKVKVKDTTRGKQIWFAKAARVQLVDGEGSRSFPTDRRYWLIVARNAKTKEVKYLVSNAPANTSIEAILRAALARWHVEKWFERAKQLAGFGDFEVRKYLGLMRHWLCSRIVMYFLAVQTTRLRGEKSADHVRASGRCLPAAVGEDHQLLAEIVA
ncbi:MAG: IS701 family transposase [Phycisphaerae bacterium]|nr:IS701 family transposase [Phycisphaerae bacterium]